MPFERNKQPTTKELYVCTDTKIIFGEGGET